ncbi:hypothetical protein ElyMa_001016200 [Elysia marginata]|uniref:Uncharacterized protein n=1 Tax=Elysia marginata TaxID=1093978 RepID=A0AAV4HKX2_9GAST|nr:hypothetical protein ElyMa_001016200 [Elysia marginata]
MHIVESRWRLFRHIRNLRRDIDIPVNKAMQSYFNQMTCTYRGRPTTALPVIINKVLSQAYPHMKLKTSNDLQTMRLLAQDRNKWRTLTRRITEFAEATDSDEPEANSGCQKTVNKTFLAEDRTSLDLEKFCAHTPSIGLYILDRSGGSRILLQSECVAEMLLLLHCGIVKL